MNQLNTLKLRLRDKIGYGMGNFTYGIISQAIATYIVFFGTNILKISGTLIGFAVSFSVVWDALTDPFMGYISDHTVSKRFGRRHLYLIIGIVGMAITNLLVWQIQPQWPDFVKFILLLLLLLVIKTFTTIYTTPYTALGAELSEDYNERTSIQGIRTMFFLLGIMTATVAGLAIFFNPTSDYPVGQDNPAAYTNMSLFATILAILFALACIITSFKYIPYMGRTQVDTKNRTSVKKVFISFYQTFKNRYFKWVAFAYLFANISSAMLSTLGLYVYTYTFKLNNIESSLAIGIVLALAVISQPMWIAISKRLDKRPAVFISLGVSIFCSMIFVALVLAKDFVAEHSYLVHMMSVILGAGVGGMFSLPLSMIADSIDYQELQDGHRSEGTYYGVLTLAYKMSQSFAIFILGVFIDVSRFDADLMTQTDFTRTVLGLAIGFGCLIAFFLALACYKQYDLNQDKVDQMQAIIKENRARLKS